MKGSDLIQVLEYVGAFKKPKPKNGRRPRKDIRSFEDLDDIELLLAKKLRQADALKKFLDDREKANKKEDKKDGKEFNLHHIAMFLVFTFPITAPLYVQYVKSMLH